MQRKFTWSIALALILALAVFGLVLADDISNDLDESIDAVAEVMPLTVGGVNGTTQLYVQPVKDLESGCNFQGSETLVVSVTSSDPSVATVSPSSITFGSCGDKHTLTVTPVSQGSTTISLAQVSNNTGGTFNLAPATFIVNVSPPPNDAPSVTIGGVEGGASYEIGAVPAATCEVADPEDGSSSFPAALSAVSGELAAYGLGAQTASCIYTDQGGLTAEASVTYNIVDTAAPEIAFDSRTPANENGWNNTDVTVTWSCTDSGSGVVEDSVSQTVSTEGANQAATGECVDHAGNTVQDTVSGINIDKTAPVIAFASRTPANANGWNNSDVTVTWSCTDSLSGVAAPEASQTVNTEGENQTATGTCSDLAGNTEDDAVGGIHIDKTAPVITGSRMPESNPYGWNNSDVTVTWTCTDPLSGLDGGCPEPEVLADEGEDLSASASVSDKAGNTAEATVSGIHIDKTAPTISGAPDRAANAHGWYNAGVTVNFTCDDDRSGVADCTAPETLGEGSGQEVTGTVTDKAGNTASTAVSGINIDTTPPTLTGAPTTAPNANGWYKEDVTIHWTGVDSLSGIDSATQPADSVITGEGENLGAGPASISDKAGNSTEASVNGIKIDRTPPTITAALSPESPDGTGWYNLSTGAPAVSFECDDALSGLDGACPSPHTFGDGANQSFSATVTDRAGNSASNGVSNVNVDLTAPTITASLSPAASSTGWYNLETGAPAVSFTCSDETSSIPGGCPASFTFGEGENQSYSVTVTDTAGNSASAGVSDIDVDLTRPTLTGAATTAPNAYGWYKDNVTIHWTGTDNLSGIDPASEPADSVITGEGEDLSATASVRDAAGNSAETTVDGIQIDRTPPAITGSRTPLANAHGWNNTDVTVTWSCIDSLSGLDGDCPAANVLSDEGEDLSATASISDKAGNSAEATVNGINIDKTEPVITAALSPAEPNDTDWYNLSTGAPTISFDCDDALSGLDGDCPAGYTFGEGPDQSYSQTIFDLAGNSASAGVADVDVDLTAPEITAELAPQDPADTGWYNLETGAPTVSFTCSDAINGSGLASDACPAPYTFGEGADQGYSATVTDVAGNSSESAGVDGIYVDLTAPTISGAPDRAANSNGWYNAYVTVSFTCIDELSDVDGCTGPVTLGEGANQSVTGTVTDKAGNTASATVSGIHIDKTAPTISGAPDRAANTNGWYNADVTVTFTCGDALSGIDSCTSPVTLGEGANQSIPGTVTDLAGNTNSTTVSGINIDKTAPVITASMSPEGPAGTGWYNLSTGAPTVSFTCSDALSGVDGDCPASQTFGDGANQSHSAAITDLAGNSASAGVSGINVDLIKPTITASLSPAAPASTGWYNENTGAPTVSFTCTDTATGSGLAVNACPPSFTFDEGENLSHSAAVTDEAGNTSESAGVSGIDVDLADPTGITFVGGPEDGASYYYGSVPAEPTCTAQDALSGLASCDVSGYSSEVGVHTLTATAVDKAGNTDKATRTYTVMAWTLYGFYRPVDPTLEGGDIIWNTIKGGSTVPLKFEVFVGPVELTDISAVKSMNAYLVPCERGIEDDVELTATGSTSLRYDWTEGQFIFNWKTPKSPEKCYRVEMTTQDSSSIEAFFKLK